MATVQLKQVRKSFGPVDIIKGIDLTIQDQELTVFVGPSGSGKSTLLRLIAGLEEISAGDLLIDGQRANDIPPAKRGLAIVFQSYALYPHMSVAENMAFSLKLAGVSKTERERKVNEAARILHLETYLHRKPKELSGGQRQRVAIGRAIVRNPRVFLFDEPLSNLDAALRVKTRLELAKLHRQLKATMVYVTHDQVEAMTMADRIVVLNEGAIEQVGTSMELYHSPRNMFVAGFIGSPRMNMIPVVVERLGPEGVAVRLTTGPTLTVPVSGESAKVGETMTLGFRPEHITLSGTPSLKARVQAVERLGSESYLSVELDGDELLTVRVNGDTVVRTDQLVELGIEEKSTYLFDGNGETLDRLPHALSSGVPATPSMVLK